MNAPTGILVPPEDVIATVSGPKNPLGMPTKITSPTFNGTLVAPGSGYESQSSGMGTGGGKPHDAGAVAAVPAQAARPAQSPIAIAYRCSTIGLLSSPIAPPCREASRRQFDSYTALTICASSSKTLVTSSMLRIAPASFTYSANARRRPLFASI